MREAIGATTVVVAVENQVWTEIEEEILILHLGTGEYYSVKNVAARVWRLIQRPTRLAEIGRDVEKAYGIPPGRAEEDVLELLRELADRELIRLESEDLQMS